MENKQIIEAKHSKSMMLSERLPLRENPSKQAEVDNLLQAAAMSQNLYGRDPQSLAASTFVFHQVLGDYPADLVELAIKRWIQREQQYPTPADIDGMIRRNGKPVVERATAAAIYRQPRDTWTAEQESIIGRFEAQQDDDNLGYIPEQRKADLEESNIIREMKKEIANLKSENIRLQALLRESRQQNALPSPKLAIQQRIENTVANMRASGASQGHITEFLESMRTA